MGCWRIRGNIPSSLREHSERSERWWQLIEWNSNKSEAEVGHKNACGGYVPAGWRAFYSAFRARPPDLFFAVVHRPQRKKPGRVAPGL
jgi:hypothetical protein